MPPRRVGDYEVHEALGTGAYGSVMLARRRSDGTKWALKQFDKNSVIRDRLGPRLGREVAIMKALDHPHVIRVVDAFQSTNNFYIVLEWAVQGELFHKIRTQGKLSERESRRYFKQLADAVSYCHCQGVAHRDIKPENLLLDAEGNLKLSDFGLANLQSVDSLLTTVAGSPHYMAPEVEYESGYNGFAADAWSCGVVLYVMLTGTFPFRPGRTCAYTLDVPDDFSPSLVELLRGLLCRDASRRMTVAAALAHSWVAEDTSLGPPSPHIVIIVTDEQAASSITDLDRDSEDSRSTFGERSDTPCPVVESSAMAVLLRDGSEVVFFVDRSRFSLTPADVLCALRKCPGLTVKSLDDGAVLKGFVRNDKTGVITSFIGDVAFDGGAREAFVSRVALRMAAVDRGSADDLGVALNGGMSELYRHGLRV